ncbi:MAG: hypothetical protein JNL24_03810 [Bacteroidia bacterium]|nr:hypothetical protein [Bacteroidia bacterium]
MTEEETNYIFQYLTCETFDYQGSQRYSTINAGLRESRLFTKRDKLTGKYNPDAECGFAGHWLGAIGYFTVLDQIGSCFKNPGQEISPKYNKIKFAIETFGFDFIENDIRKLNALIALRNAFTHDFNLLNIPDNERLNDLQRCKFTVYPDPDNENEVVKLPTTLWNGDILGKDFHRTDDTTFVNIFGFGTFVEKIHARIIEKVKTNEIETIIAVPELINKYTFITSVHSINSTT